MPSSDAMNIWARSDLATPWCVHVAATLRVADHIAAGKSHIDELATACGAHAESLHRVLRHLVSKGVFEETEPGVFALNAAARGLLEPSIRLGLDLDSFGGRMAGAWASLLTAVRTGEPAYREVFGRPFWEDLEAHPNISKSFDALMGPDGHDTPDPGVLIGGDWDSVKTVVDVGGGTGALLAEVLRAHPNVSGILVDLPSTVERSDRILEAAGVADRVLAIGQSFFERLPAGADLYLLKSILADWPDRDVARILERCAEAARPNGRIVIVNGVSPGAASPNPALLMMVLVGGKERTLGELQELAAAAGLEVEATEQQASGRFLVQLRVVS